MAFAYEDSYFNPEVGNWLDLRPFPSEPGGARSVPYAVTWCHGAPGITLSRLRAMTLDPAHRESLAAMACTGLRTTLKAIEQKMQLPRHDATLCHGLAGLNEVLWTAGLLLDEKSHRASARAIALNMIEKHSEVGDWPTGVPSGGPNPSFMVGTAGIGYHFLRLDSPEHVPPILALVE